MALPHQPTESLVSSSAASGSQTVSGAEDYRHHTFIVTIGTAATVAVEASVDGTRWAPVNDARTGSAASVTADGVIQVEGVFPHLRVAWTGNNDSVTVDVVQA